MIDFDNIDDWAPKLEAALCPHLSNPVQKKLAEASTLSSLKFRSAYCSFM